MVGMDDLEVVAIGLQLARHEFGFVQRQQLARPAAILPEIDEGDAIALPVYRQHAKRRTRAATGAIIDRRQQRADDSPRIGHVEPVGEVTIDPAHRQMKGDIDRALEVQSLQRTGQRRPYPLEQGNFGKERIENIGSHGYLTRSSPAGTVAQMAARTSLQPFVLSGAERPRRPVSKHSASNDPSIRRFDFAQRLIRTNG